MEGIVMVTKLAVGVATVVMAVGIGLAGTASAAGGHGVSGCSGSGKPDGVVDPTNPATFSNPGEVISFLAPNLNKPGQTVIGFCNPHLTP
jgi:hypothetical protein